MAGCDISHYQTVSDFDVLARAAEFVILKATEGTTYRDPTYTARIAALRARRVRVGAYHFASGGDPTAEADAFLAYSAPRPGDLLALDVEAGILTAKPGGQLVTWCGQWLGHVQARTGIAPHLYMSTSVVNTRDWSRLAPAFPLWLAAYTTTVPTVRFWTKPAIWQHTSTGRIAGIAGPVDLDIAYAAPKPAPAPAPAPKPAGDDMPLSDADADKIATATVNKIMRYQIATVDESQANKANPTGARTYTVADLWARVIRLLGLSHSNLPLK